MSYHIFFFMSTSLSRELRVPKGTLKLICSQINDTEKILGLQRTPTFTPDGEKPRPGWFWSKPGNDMLAQAGPETDTTIREWYLEDRKRDGRISKMALAVREHNHFVRTLYSDLSKWAEQKQWKRNTAEKITVAQSHDFWGGLRTLELPRDIWDRDHFTDHMEHLHELLTTGSSRGTELDCEPFKPQQAAALISLFEDEIDQWGFDMRFAVPLDENLNPYDFIASSYDGGYDWCSHCGPIHRDDFHARCAVCPRAKTGECKLKNDHPAEFEDEDET